MTAPRFDNAACETLAGCIQEIERNTDAELVVVVRARSSGDARVVAAEAELDYMEIDALPGDGNSTTSSSAFRNEKLYTVIDETDPSYPLDGPREVVAGTVRVDNIRPTEL